jgi:hypothetical protein
MAKRRREEQLAAVVMISERPSWVFIYTNLPTKTERLLLTPYHYSLEACRSPLALQYTLDPGEVLECVVTGLPS